jgi:hypothetical protein
MDAIEQMLAQQQEQARLAREERDAFLRAQLERRTPLIDTTPTAAFLDSMFGGQSVKGAQAVQQALREQDDLLNQLIMNKAADAQARVAANQAFAMQRDAAKQAEQNERFDAKNRDNIEKEIQTAYERDIIMPLKERDAQFKTMETALAKGDSPTIMMILGQFARGISGEKGVLTDKDIERVFPQTARQKIANIQAFLTGKAPADPEVVSKARELLDIAKANARKIFGDSADQKARQYASRSLVKRYGLDAPGGVIDTARQEAWNTINQFSTSPSASTTASTAAPRSEKVEAILKALREKGK